MTADASGTELSNVAPSRRSRIALGTAIALASAVFTWYQHGYLIAHASPPDSLYLWRAANVLLVGHNPWALQALNTAPHDAAGRMIESRIALADPLYYPMPAVLLWVPLAKLPFLVASTVFNAGAAFLFVLAMTRSGLYRAWACGSIPFMIAMRFGQWSPLIVAAWVYPWLSVFLVAKPNLGAAVFAARPSRRASAICAAVLLLPTLLAPWWIRDWLHNIQNDLGRSAPHPAPVTMFGGAGVVLLIALCRWRRPEARLLALLACVPQLPYWADQLPLLLVAQSRRQMLALTVATLVGFLIWVQFGRTAGDVIDSIRPFAIVFTYVPALALILVRPNRGELPEALKRLVHHLPEFIRGQGRQAD
jgi:hypothetical protein